MTPVFKVTPTTQQYDWGKVGSESKVAQLASASISGFHIESKPYAELWMGTHPTSPSMLDGSRPLSSYLEANPSLMGGNLTRSFPDAAQGNLPFLFKVLSIEKALSIQTHPDKKTAEDLHKRLPNIYKDANHKPELALALTLFHALCGFLPLPDIAENLKSTPELSILIPAPILGAFHAIASSSTPTGDKEKAALKNLFSALMNTKEDAYKKQLEILVQRYESQDSVDELQSLVLRLNSQFPGDIGVFCAFMLNHVQLQPGEAIFLGAGEPHAYVSGDIIECMANSDNVIRAGLTPKLRDIPNLISCLTYVAAKGTEHQVKPTTFRSSSVSTLYDPPIPEFSVVQVKLEASGKEIHPALKGPSLIVVTQGAGAVAWRSSQDGLKIGLGDVLFIGADTEKHEITVMLSLVFDHFSPPRHVFVLLYTNTTNSSAIKAKIIQASIAGDDEKETVNFAFIDAALITSSLHLQTAIHQALIADDQGALRTKTPHSEILWALNPTNNITEAIRRYGVSDATASLIVVRITDSDSWPQHGLSQIDALVDGTRAPFSELERITDWGRIRKYHKLGSDVDAAKIDNIVTSSVAMKSVMG